MELKSVRDKTKMEITVISPNQSSQVNVHSYSLGSEVAARVSNILNMTSETGFSLLVNGKSIGDNEYIMDAISSLEEIGAQETSFTFSFRKQVLLPEEPRSSAQNSFAFDQVFSFLFLALNLFSLFFFKPLKQKFRSCLNSLMKLFQLNLKMLYLLQLLISLFLVEKKKMLVQCQCNFYFIIFILLFLFYFIFFI